MDRSVLGLPEDGVCSIPLRLDLPEGTIDLEIPLSADSERLVVLAFKVLAISSEVADMAAQAVRRAGHEISCKKGCGVCCRQLVPLSPPEAAMVYEFVETMPAARQRRTRDRFAQQNRRLTELGFMAQLERLQDPTISDQEYHAIVEAYFRLKVPCPFLVEEGCSIYPVRPSMCREYLVTSPPRNCVDPVRTPVSRVPVSLRLSEALARTWRSLTGEAVFVIPLVLAPMWVSRYPGVRKVRGPSVAVLRTLLGHMSSVAASRYDGSVSSEGD
jgi:Fe-S-cluster containining protein